MLTMVTLASIAYAAYFATMRELSAQPVKDWDYLPSDEKTSLIECARECALGKADGPYPSFLDPDGGDSGAYNARLVFQSVAATLGPLCPEIREAMQETQIRDLEDVTPGAPSEAEPPAAQETEEGSTADAAPEVPAEPAAGAVVEAEGEAPAQPVASATEVSTGARRKKG